MSRTVAHMGYMKIVYKVVVFQTTRAAFLKLWSSGSALVVLLD